MFLRQLLVLPFRQTFTPTRCNALTAVLAASLLCVGGQASATRVDIVDGEGFESPAYSLGVLEGQAAKLTNDAPFPGSQAWLASIGTTSSAVVQSAVVLSGSQAVRITRTANEAAGGGQFGVPVTAWPDGARFVYTEWNMYVENASGPTGAFGPFFGVFSYDDDGVGASNGQTGSLGVDATTGDVLYQETGTGNLVETGSSVSFGEWNNFILELDYLTHEYTVYLNDVELLTEPFIDGAGLDQFTDAPIVTAAAAGDSLSQALTGRAYFDGYEVYQTNVRIPEPTTLVLGLIALVSTQGILRRRAKVIA